MSHDLSTTPISSTPHPTQSSEQLSNQACLEAKQVTGGYGQQPIIHGIDLSLVQGEWLTLVGANGSGKSTFLRFLSRILKPTDGAVLLNHQDIHRLDPTAVARKLALLPQQQTLPSGITVEQLVSLGRSPHQPWWQWDLDAAGWEKVDQALQWTELETYRHRPVSDLSGGERQRAFLALALAQEPQVLLLDEPTTFLDIHYQLQLLEFRLSLISQFRLAEQIAQELNQDIDSSSKQNDSDSDEDSDTDSDGAEDNVLTTDGIGNLRITVTGTRTPRTIQVSFAMKIQDLVETLADDALVGIAGSRLTAEDSRFDGLTVVSQAPNPT